MTEKERIEKFKSHNLVVNCRTEEEAKEFITWCYKNGFKWGEVGNKRITWFSKKTCYRLYEDDTLTYSSFSDYSSRGLEIMTYQDFFKEDEMTNFECLIEYVEKNKPSHFRMLCGVIFEFKNKKQCDGNCKSCEFREHINTLNYLKQKHDNKIKVTQFEYDLLKAYIENCNISNYNQRLRNYHIVVKMKEQGYFKNLDLDKTIGEIKDKLEVEDV